MISGEGMIALLLRIWEPGQLYTIAVKHSN